MAQDIDFQTKQGILTSVLYPHRRFLIKLWKALTFEPKSEAFGAALIGSITISFLTLYVYDFSIISICGLVVIIGSMIDFALKKQGWVNILSPQADSEDKYFSEIVMRELTYLKLQGERTLSFFDTSRILHPFKFYSMCLLLLIILSELTGAISAWVLIGFISIFVSLIPSLIKLCRNNNIEPSQFVQHVYSVMKEFQQKYQLQVIVSNLVLLGLSILFRGFGLANLLIGLNVLSLIYFLVPTEKPDDGDE